MRAEIGRPGDPVPERTTYLRPYQQAAVDALRSGEYLPPWVTTNRLLPILSDEEADCLAIAIRATYKPGVVAVQMRFHGKDHGPRAQRTLAMLDRLAVRGLLVYEREVWSRDVDTRSHYYWVTPAGRRASVPVVHRIKGAA